MRLRRALQSRASPSAHESPPSHQTANAADREVLPQWRSPVGFRTWEDEPAEAAVLLGHVRGTPDVLQTVEVLMRGRRRRVNAAHLRPYDATLVGRCIHHPDRKSRDGVRNRMIRNPGPQDSAAAAGRGSRPHGSGPKGRDGMATAQTQLSQGVSA